MVVVLVLVLVACVGLVFLGEVKARPIDIISFSLSYLSKSKSADKQSAVKPHFTSNPPLHSLCRYGSVSIIRFPISIPMCRRAIWPFSMAMGVIGQQAGWPDPSTGACSFDPIRCFAVLVSASQRSIHSYPLHIFLSMTF